MLRPSIHGTLSGAVAEPAQQAHLRGAAGAPPGRCRGSPEESKGRLLPELGRASSPVGSRTPRELRGWM